MCESEFFCCAFSVRGFILFLFNGYKISELVLTCGNLCKNSLKPCSKLRCHCLYPPSHIRGLHVFAVHHVTASCSYFYGLTVVSNNSYDMICTWAKYQRTDYCIINQVSGFRFPFTAGFRRQSQYE